MVHFLANDIISMSEFPYSWRLTDPKWDLLPRHLLDRLIPMNDRRAIEIGRVGKAFRHSGPYAMRTDSFHAIKTASLAGTGQAESVLIKS